MKASKVTAYYFTIEQQIAESISVLETSKESSICHFYFFKDRNLLYQSHVCNGGHDASLRAILLRDFKIILVKNNTYRVISNLPYN